MPRLKMRVRRARESDLDHVMVVSSFSKTYSMAGMRIGWLIGSQAAIKKLRRYHMFTTTVANTPFQWAQNGKPHATIRPLPVLNNASRSASFPSAVNLALLALYITSTNFLPCLASCSML